MPVRLIPNQLVKLYKTQDFNALNKRRTQDYRQYCQLVREEQTTMFQVELLPDSESIITNGYFTDNISGWFPQIPQWQWASGRLQGEVQATSTPPSIIQPLTVTPARAYVLTMTIQFTNITSDLAVQLTDTAGTSVSTVIYTAAQYGTLPFTITQYWISGASTSAIIFFNLNGYIDDLVYIDDVTLLRASAPAVTLEDCSGNLIETLSTFAQSGNIAVFQVEWFGKPEGCYRICLEDTEDTEVNYLDGSLALGTEGGAPIELEQGGFLKWFG